MAPGLLRRSASPSRAFTSAAIRLKYSPGSSPARAVPAATSAPQKRAAQAVRPGLMMAPPGSLSPPVGSRLRREEPLKPAKLLSAWFDANAVQIDRDELRTR